MSISEASAYPRLTGRRVALRSVQPADYQWLYEAATSEEVGFQWRLRGATPDPESFVGFLWRGCEFQSIVVARSSGTNLGIIQLLDLNTRSGHASVAMMLTPDAINKGWPLEGLVLFIGYVFRSWNLRKLYFESLEFSASRFSSAIGPLLVEEGVLRDHEYFDGGYVDLRLLALYRSKWQEMRAQWDKLTDDPS